MISKYPVGRVWNSAVVSLFDDNMEARYHTGYQVYEG